MSSLPAITVCCSTFMCHHISTALSHPQLPTAAVTQCQTHPKEESAHVLSLQNLTATSHKGFPPPQEGALRPAVALGCSCYTECGSLVSACSTHISFTSL